MAEKTQKKGNRLILPLPGNEGFARRLADAGDWELGALETRRFPDGETYVRILSDVKEKAVDLVCTLARPDDGFLRSIFTADAARDLGARQVNLIAPYLSYMRQDRRFQAGEAVTSKSFARLVSSSFDRLVTVDPHLHRYAALSALYTIPTDTLHAAPLLADWIAAEVEKPLIVGPDEESEQWVSAIAERVGAPHAVLRKIRHGDRNVDIALPDLSEWRGRTPVLADDIAASGHTLIEAARQLHAYVTLNSKTRPSHMDLRDVAWKGVDQISKGGYHGTRFTGTEQGVIVDSVISEKWPNGYHQRSVLKLKKPLKKDFPQHGNNVNSFRSGECEVSFDNATRKVFWNVSENNHAVDDARESALGKALLTSSA